MGSTITTGRLAAAIETQQGRKLFVLFEETYSSNVSPKTPRWCCVGLGYVPETLKRIFELASSCEGGMLKNRSGRITPEGYIATWLKELANPLVLHHTNVRVQAGEGLYHAIPTARLDEAVNLLACAERLSQANELHDTGIVILDLARDADAVLMLQAGLKVRPWRLIERHTGSQRRDERNPDLGHAPPSGRTPTLDVPVALRVDQDVRLIRDEDGAWRCGGWQYAMVGQHVRDLWQNELECPGHHRKRIAAFRDALENAPQAPDGLVVEITDTGTEDTYYRQKIEALRLQAGGGDPFRVTMTSENEYSLTNLPRECAQWLVPGRHQATARVQAALAI